MTRPLTIVAHVANEADSLFLKNLSSDPLVERCIYFSSSPDQQFPVDGERWEVESFYSQSLVRKLIETCSTDHLLFILPGEGLRWKVRAFARLVQAATESGAGFVYSDFRDQEGEKVSDHPLIDYQLGSIRDNFDFGGAVLISRTWALRALANGTRTGDQLRWGGLYDLRLRLSEIAPIVHLPEFLYTKVRSDLRATGERVFDYVDPAKRAYQIEMELVATEHLSRIGAFLSSGFNKTSSTESGFPVFASVIIPVRNRVKTIAQAIESALAQRTDFDFNVIVVDNHSTDGTGDEIERVAAVDSRVVRIVPLQTDLGIGGCWNEAVFSPQCGRYCVQLDSDDLYLGTDVLARVANLFRTSAYAMIIGSYKTVDFELNELPPGLVDHREWTPENGRNNALRINGLGAPRAFDVSILREIGFPDVSYGEDYAVALRLCRDYELGRIYEPLYLARRWGGNSDSALPLSTMNRYDHYKDWIRTNEIRARQRLISNANS